MQDSRQPSILTLLVLLGGILVVALSISIYTRSSIDVDNALANGLVMCGIVAVYYAAASLVLQRTTDRGRIRSQENRFALVTGAIVIFLILLDTIVTNRLQDKLSLELGRNLMVGGLLIWSRLPRLRAWVS